MKIVIIGGGKVGYELANQLSREEHDIVLVDNNRRVVKQIIESLDMMAIYGNGASFEVQKQADVGKADLLIAVTPKDEVNMICCIVGRKLGCANAIARVRDPEYAKQMHFLREELGLSMSVNPEFSTAREVFRLMQYPGFLKRDSFAKGRVEIVELGVAANGPLDKVSLFELPKKLKVKVLVCAIQRGSDVVIPSGNFRLEAGDRIHVTAPSDQLVALIESLGLRKKKAKNAMLVGGGRITQYLADSLLKTGTNVKIIEQNSEKSIALAEKFSKATVINADGSSQHILNSENVSQMDTVVTLTNMDEENLIISMFAKRQGVPQVITKLNRTEYLDLFRETGIDCVVSPKQLCAEDIVRYVRAMQNTSGSGVVSVHQLLEGKVEAIEMHVTGSAKCVNIPLKDLRFKPNILLSCITRGGQVIIPGGNDMMLPGDTVVVVSLKGRVILDLNDIFGEQGV